MRWLIMRCSDWHPMVLRSFVKKHSMSEADEVYRLSLKGKNKPATADVRKPVLLRQTDLERGKVEERWVNTVDGEKNALLGGISATFRP